MNFTEKEKELLLDALETAVSITDWDNFSKKHFENPKEHQHQLYLLIDKINETKCKHLTTSLEFAGGSEYIERCKDCGEVINS